MVLGIIAEGKGDCAVLENILWSILDDNDEIHFLRPDFNIDESDIKHGAYTKMTPNKFSSWNLVKEDCEKAVKFELFLNSPIAEERKIAIHLDTAECEDYGVVRPPKDKNYCTTLRQAVINQINTWLDNQYQCFLHYAICIEETEAWVLPIYEKKDSSGYSNPKDKFQKVINDVGNKDKKFKQEIVAAFQKKEFDKMDFFSQPLRKPKSLSNAANFNQSLSDFINSF